MKNKSYIIVGEIETTSIKTAIFDSNLQIIEDSFCPLNTYYYNDIPEQSAQNPDEWIQGFVKCMDDLYKKAPYLFSSISLLAFTGRMEDLIVIDNEGKSLYNAFLCSDSRAKEETKIITDYFGIKRLFEITGNEFNVLNTMSRILWLKRSTPDLFSKALSFIFGSKDFINFKLTGKNFTDYTTASITGLFNINKKTWDNELINYLTIQNKSLPQVDKAKRIIGKIKEKWVNVLHFKQRIPVLNGMGDCASVLLAAGIYKENEAYLYGNTAGWCSLLSKNKKEMPVNNLFCHDGKNYINVSFILNAGNVINWGIKTFYIKDKTKKIDDLIKTTDTDKNLIFLPYLNEEQSPFHDESARGVIYGLTLNTKNENILKSIFEGVAFAFYHNIIELGIKNRLNLRVSGEIFQFNAFCQILADVSGISIEKLENKSSNPIFGTALLASQSLNLISKDASDYTKIQKCFTPDKSKKNIYSRLFETFRNLYHDLKDDFKKLSNIKLAL